MARLFLLPVALCLLWWGFLALNGIPVSKGRKGFVVILVGSAGLAAFLSLMIWVTR